MEYVLYLIYGYVVIYTFYMLILALRNFKDTPFRIEKKYSKHDEEKRNFGVIIYSHNNRICLEELIQKFKMQDYPLAKFKVFAILDNCNDGSENLFNRDNFVHVMNIQDVGTYGKQKAVSILLDRIDDDKELDAYVFIDATRAIDEDFLTLANVALRRADVVAGEVNINRENLDVVDKIKAVHKKYLANFFKQARTLLGLATCVDPGLLIMKKDAVVDLKSRDFLDSDSALGFSLILSKTGHKCVYNPNIQSSVLGQDCTFKKTRISKRFKFLFSNLRKIEDFNFTYVEHICSLLNPNCWFLILAYAILISYTFSFQFIVKCNFMVFSAAITFVVFCLSLVNAKMNFSEICLLCFYPIYSLFHIIHNFPVTKFILKTLGADSDPEVDKLKLDVLVETRHGERSCRLEFISTEKGLSKIRFIYKNKKYTTSSHFRMIDALSQLKSKMEDYGLTLKICSCCSKFVSCFDGSTNMLKGECHNDYPSPLLREPRKTLVWNSCQCFEAAKFTTLIEEIAKEVENQEG